MQPVYINHTASIHADTPSGEHSYLSAKMGVACGLECINTLPSRKVDAIITATGLGCLADTEKFLNTIIENE